jgi:uncharacterized protein (DUF58 family)
LQSKTGEYFVVQPAIGRMLPSWTELLNIRTSGAKHRRIRSLSDEGEFFGLRDYRHGDSPRWIHWRSSARRDELVVKQFQQPESREVVILLDLFQLNQETSTSDRQDTITIEDKAVEFVATLVQQVASSNTGMITVAIADVEPTIAARIQSRAQATFILERLAVARATNQDSLSIALQRIEEEHHRIEKLIVVSNRAKPDRFESVDTTSGRPTVFWHSSMWLNSGAGDLAKYFVPAD